MSEWKIGKYHLWVQFQGISFIFGKCTIDRNSGAAAAVSIPGKNKGWKCIFKRKPRDIHIFI